MSWSNRRRCRHHGAVRAHRDFYEDDEPIADIIAAREGGGEPFVTAPPRRGFNSYFDPFRSYLPVVLGQGSRLTETLGDMQVRAG